MLKNIIYKVLVCMILICLIFPYFYVNIIYAVPVDENGNEITSTTNPDYSEIEDNINPDDAYTNIEDNNLGADVDDDTGTILQALLEVLMAVGDAIMSILTSCMIGTSFENVMVKWSEVDTSNLSEANTTKTFSQEEIDEFKNNKGIVPELKYPNFKYTPEEIFKGEIELFSIDFIGGNVVKNGEEQANSSEGWNALRGTIASWYRTLRYIAIVGLLAILIYIGIKIIITSSAGKKADYKKSFINWVLAVFLIFTMHYIMAFIIAIIQNLTTLISASIGNVRVVFEDKTFATNFLGLARFQSQTNSLITKLGYIVIYFGFITLTCKFTYIYFKRMLNMAFLTLSAPIVAMMYPLDKLDGGKAKGFGMWLREYIYNALLQPVHLLLYNILIGSAVQLATNNAVYAIIALFFLAEAEKLMKKIFGFGRARGGTVGGLAKTVGGLALASSMSKNIRGIFGSMQRGNSNSLSGANSNSDGSINKNDFSSGPDEDLEDEKFERRYGRADSANNDPLGIDKTIFNKRQELTDKDLKNTKEKTKGFENAFNYLKQNGLRKGKNEDLNNATRDKLKYMRSIIKGNEDPFNKANMPLQYNDKYSKLNSNQLLELMRDAIKNGDMDKAQEYFDVLNRRMMENKYFMGHGGPRAFMKRKFSNLSDDELRERYNEAKANNNIEDILECEAEIALRNKDYKTYEKKLDEIENFRLGVSQNPSGDPGSAVDDTQSNNNGSDNQTQGDANGSMVRGTSARPNRTNVNYDRAAQSSKLDRLRRGTISGLGAVAKGVVKPVWDTDKKAPDNIKRLGGNIAKGAVQTIFGVTTAAVQAGISSTDGKYGPGELGASFAGGVVLGGKLYNKGERAVKDMLRDTRLGKKETRKAQIAKDWSERPDVQDNFNQYYGSHANEMRLRARNNFAKAGITDFNDQKRLFRYSNYLRSQNNSYSKDEADKLAVDVFRFRNNVDSTYGIPESKEAKKQFLDEMVQQNRTSKSSKDIRTYYSKMLDNSMKLERVEDNEEYDYL